MNNNKAIGTLNDFQSLKDEVCKMKDLLVVQKEEQNVTKIHHGRFQKQKKKNVVKKTRMLGEEHLLASLKECNADMLQKAEIIMILEAKNEKFKKDQIAKQCEIRALKDKVAKKEKENRKLRCDLNHLESYTNAKLLKFQDKNSQLVTVYKTKIFQKEQKIIELQAEKQKMRKQIDEYTSRDNEEAPLSSSSNVDKEEDTIRQVEIERLEMEVHKLKEDVIEKENENEKLCKTYGKYKINTEKKIQKLEKQYTDVLSEKETKEITQERKIQELENQNEMMKKQIDEYMMKEEKTITSIIGMEDKIRNPLLNEIQLLKKEIHTLKGKVLKKENKNNKLCKEYNTYKINNEQTIANLQKQFFSP